MNKHSFRISTGQTENKYRVIGEDLSKEYEGMEAKKVSAVKYGWFNNLRESVCSSIKSGRA